MKIKAPSIPTFAAGAFAIVLTALLTWAYYNMPDPQDAIPAVVEEEISPITTDEAISYIEQGEAIVLLATEAFAISPSKDLGRTLLQIADEYNMILGSLCQTNGTQDACRKAKDSLVLAYEALFAYAEEEEERQ